MVSFPRITAKTGYFLALKAHLNPYLGIFFLTKPSHILREPFVKRQNLLAFCESLLSGDETFSHFARALCQVTKPSCILREHFVR